MSSWWHLALWLCIEVNEVPQEGNGGAFGREAAHWIVVAEPPALDQERTAVAVIGLATEQR